MAGALLVPDQDVPQLGVEERVVRGQDGAARDPEHDLRPCRLETADEGLSSGHLLCHGPSPVVWCGHLARTWSGQTKTPRPRGHARGCALAVTGSQPARPITT